MQLVVPQCLNHFVTLFVLFNFIYVINKILPYLTERISPVSTFFHQYVPLPKSCIFFLFSLFSSSSSFFTYWVHVMLLIWARMCNHPMALEYSTSGRRPYWFSSPQHLSVVTSYWMALGLMFIYIGILTTSSCADNTRYYDLIGPTAKHSMSAR